MNRTGASAVLAALGALCLGGCGTFTNLCFPEDIPPGKGCRVYGGTRLDLEQTAELYQDRPGSSSGPVSKTTQELVGTCIFAADLPLSLAADTITLPFTLGAALAPAEPTNSSQAPTTPRPTTSGPGPR